MADTSRFPDAEEIPGNIVDALACLDREETTRIIDSIADGLFTVDRQLVIRSISRRFQRQMGFSADQVVGRRCRDVLRGSNCDSDCPMHRTFDHHASVERCRETVCRHDGSAIPVCVTTAVLHSADGQVEGLLGILCQESGIESLRGGAVASEPDPADALRHVLEAHRWNASRTAIALGISRTTLWRRMKRYSLLEP